MKKFQIITFITLLLSAVIVQGQSVNIKGKVTGATSSKLTQVSFIYNGTGNQVAVDTTSKTFNTTIELKNPQFVEINSSGTGTHKIYMIPNETLELTINKPARSISEITIGDGNMRRINEVMDTLRQTVASYNIDISSQAWGSQLIGRPEIAKKAISNARKAISNNQKFFDKVAPEFKKSFDFFANSFIHFTALDTYSFKEIEAVLQELSKSDLDVTALTIPYFRDYLKDITNAYAARKLEYYGIATDRLKESHISNLIAAEALVKFIPNQEVLNFMLTEKVSYELTVNGAKNPNYSNFLFDHISDQIADKFKKKFDQLKENSAVSPEGERADTFDFEFVDASGKKYTLADFKGKLLYFDFWASWCGPCKVQMPFLRDIEKKYEGKDIVFANVNLDTSQEIWLKDVEKENLHGTVLYAESHFRNPFISKYGIASIPRFMLIDANGKMISDDAPRPQNAKELIELIDANLNTGELEMILTKHFEAIGVKNLKGKNGLKLTATRTLMGIESESEIHYAYPDKFRVDEKSDANPAMLEYFGPAFTSPKFMAIHGDSFFGNMKNIKKSSKNWMQRIGGLELFLKSQIGKITIKLAPENASNNDNSFVVQINENNVLVKYFIDKDTYLIKKSKATLNAEPREGGGVFNVENKFSDYRNVNGLMIPFRLDLNNNIASFIITSAELLPINDRVFSNIKLEDL